MNFETVKWEKNCLKIIDQTLLPEEFKIISCNTVNDVWDAIKKLKVRGAPAIGIAGAYGAYLGIKEIDVKNYEQFFNESKKILTYLEKCRPTAVNLKWALGRVCDMIFLHRNKDIKEIKKEILKEAHKILEEDIEMCQKIGENGSKLLKDGFTVLTHCNAGGLATSGYGTALAPIYKAKEKGMNIKVFADETRPLLQGSRLTAWELNKNNIDVTVITDNMAAHLFKTREINCVIVGADRIAKNGDTANKIGTYGLAIHAKAHGVPFYVAAPASTFDLSMMTGEDIPIEERERDEVDCGFGKRTAPKEVKIFNPAFDVTPSKMISAIITEKQVYYPPYKF